jgi:UDP-3-O-[3-hydroxymyristoyl] glucosamine N-acyltransferase
MPEVSLGEIADFVGGAFSGSRDARVIGVAPLADATDRHISFLSNPKYASQVATTRAAAVLVARDVDGDGRFIRVDNPYFAMSQVVARWFAERPAPYGISPHAVVSKWANLGANAGVGHFVSIGDNVTIGANALIYSNVTIEPDCEIGEGTILYPNVSIYHGTKIGKRCIIHSGVVIGGDGYGFAFHEGRHHKIPQIGSVRIEDDVEIGAGTTIDRGALGETVIGEGTKIDNLCQIGHNVRIGKHCLLVAQAGIAGSSTLGDYVVIAGQSGVSGHVRIGNRAQIAAKSAALADVADGEKVMGIPAIPFRDFAKREAMLKRMVRKKNG